MARSVRPLILLAIGVILGGPAFAEPSPADAPDPRRRKDPDATPSPEFENVRKALDALTPEQRKRFQENFWKWANLPPEEKKALRDREEMRKRFIEQDVQAAVQETGLQLEGEPKAKFMQRYAEERRKIEEQLRKETVEKRKPMVKEMIARLRAEFETIAPADPSTAPVAPAVPPKP